MKISGELRPHDWVHRLCGLLAIYKDGKTIYSPLLQPGDSCIYIDKQLEELSPIIYEFVTKFAKENSLDICVDN